MDNEYNNIDIYLKGVKISANGLGPEKEKQLSKIIRHSNNQENKNRAVEEMVNGNLGLVLKCASEVAGGYCAGLSYMDLVSEGNIWLLYCARRFSYKKDCRFSTYAYPIIRWHILRAIHSNTFIHIPAHITEYRKKFNELEYKYHGKITRKILMQELNIDRTLAEDIINAFGLRVSSLDYTLFDNKTDSLIDKIKDDGVPDPLLETDRTHLKRYLDEICEKCLNDREREIMKIMFYTNNPTYYSISSRVGISPERVRQVYARSLRKIRRYFFDMWVDEHDEKVDYGDPKRFRSTRKKDRYIRNFCVRYNIDAKSKEIFQNLIGQ